MALLTAFRNGEIRSFTTDDALTASTAPTPPPRTSKLAHRAKSYSAFYDIVQSHLRRPRQRHSLTDVNSAVQTVTSQADYERWAASSSAVFIDRALADHQSRLDQLNLMVSHLDSVADHADAALDLVKSLTESFRVVEHQTTQFQHESEGYVHEHRRLITLADDIAENVQYYLHLEPISRKLNDAKAGDYVGQREFSDTLLLLDQCLAYMAAHPEQRDAHSYGSRYRQLLTRALALIRTKFTNALRGIATDVARRIADRQLNDTTMSTLLYAKFRVGAPEMKRLGLEIQKRVSSGSDGPSGTTAETEYDRLMNELFQSYATTRGRLVSPLIAKKLGEMALSPSINKDLVSLARATIGYIRLICIDEYELWNEWFGVEGSLYEFLDSICEPLYDYLRPRIIRETRILRLCEICSLIQTTYLDLGDFDDPNAVACRGLDFGRLIQPALQDSQTRLIFLALNILRNDIEYFKPTPDDLDYPARLKGPAVPAQTAGPVLSGTRSKHGMLDSDILDEEGNDLFSGLGSSPETWYPTLRRAVWLLGRVYRLVNSTIFDDLARQILHQTTQSFVFAAGQIAVQRSSIDSSLFLIKHLLLLKQHIGSFDLESGVVHPPEVDFDFSGLASTFWGSDWLGMPGKLVRAIFHGDIGRLIPIVIQDYRSARDEVDGILRSSIGTFVEDYAGQMTKPLRPDWSGDLSKAQDPTVVTGSETGFVTGAMPAALCEVIVRAVPELRSRLDEYVTDPRTREMLVAAVMEHVMATYANFWHHQTGGPARSARSPTAKGKERDVDLWPPTAFSDWCDQAFGVGRGVVGAESGE